MQKEKEEQAASATHDGVFSTKRHIVRTRHQRRRRGQGVAVIVFKKKSLLAVSTTAVTTLLLILLGSSCCFLVMSAASCSLQQHLAGVYSFRLQSFSTTTTTTMSRRRFYRHHRLFASVAATSSSADTVRSALSKDAKPGRRDSSSTGGGVVELKYMDYLPHDNDSSSTQHHNNNNNHVPIIFLHGLLGNKKNFATIATSLGLQLKKKRRIIGLDLRNHGTFMLRIGGLFYPCYLLYWFCLLLLSLSIFTTHLLMPIRIPI
jgi:hypothetical protein